MGYRFENDFLFVSKYLFTIILYLMPWAIRNECVTILYNNNYTHKQFNILKAHNYYLNASILYMNTFLIKCP